MGRGLVKMVNKCEICRQNTLVFIWSTSRAIDKEKLKEIEQFKSVVNLERLGFPLCWHCIAEHHLIVSTKEE